MSHEFDNNEKCGTCDATLERATHLRAAGKWFMTRNGYFVKRTFRRCFLARGTETALFFLWGRIYYSFLKKNLPSFRFCFESEFHPEDSKKFLLKALPRTETLIVWADQPINRKVWLITPTSWKNPIQRFFFLLRLSSISQLNSSKAAMATFWMTSFNVCDTNSFSETIPLIIFGRWNPLKLRVFPCIVKRLFIIAFT